jgi:DNA polymerase-3 subunit epsilon
MVTTPMTDREKAAAWAAVVLNDPSVVILDTETTGLGAHAEVCQVAVLAIDGTPLVDVLVQPTVPVEAGAQRIHGIGPEQLSTAPAFDAVWPQLVQALEGKHVLIYNAAYDLRVLRRSARQVGINDGVYYRATPWLAGARLVTCAMLEYSAWVGEIGNYGDYRWQKLPGGDHSALGDCRAVLDVLKRMAGRTA